MVIWHLPNEPEERQKLWVVVLKLTTEASRMWKGWPKVYEELGTGNNNILKNNYDARVLIGRITVLDGSAYLKLSCSPNFPRV